MKITKDLDLLLFFHGLYGGYINWDLVEKKYGKETVKRLQKEIS